MMYIYQKIAPCSGEKWHETIRSGYKQCMHVPRAVFPNSYHPFSLQWRHNDHNGVSNHQPHGCLLNRLIRRRSKKTSKLRVTGLCAGNSPGPVNSPHKGPVTRKMFPFDDVIMCTTQTKCRHFDHIFVAGFTGSCYSENLVKIASFPSQSIQLYVTVSDANFLICLRNQYQWHSLIAFRLRFLSSSCTNRTANANEICMRKANEAKMI